MGGTQKFEVVLTWELEVLAIVMEGGAKHFHKKHLIGQLESWLFM